MTSFEIYTLIICLIVYVMLAGIGTFMILTVLKLMLKLIRSGANDEEILAEYNKSQGKQKNCIIDCIFSGVLTFALLVVFIFSTYVGCTQNTYFENTPTFKIVNSASMSFKNEKNHYLFTNGLDNQFSTFDLILTYELPKEEDLKLYDIVIYEIDGILVIHRIVKIEEPGPGHPNERWFLLQGDAISQADRFPVRYSQMRGIYRDEKIPFIGSFIAFMQSPAGYMCMILVGLAIIFTPIMERKLKKATEERLAIMFAKQNAIDLTGNTEASDANTTELSDVNTADTSDANAVDDSDANTVDTSNANTVDDSDTEASELSDNSTETADDLLLSSDELSSTEDSASVSPFAHLAGRRDNRTFDERLSVLPIAKGRYDSIYSLLRTVSNIREIESRKMRTFKSGNVSIIRFNVKGKTLNSYLGLAPSEYENTKYIFTDVSSVKKYENYPMRIKLTSDRQLRWVKELISEKVTKSGLTFVKEHDIPVEITPTVSRFAHLTGKRDDRTFDERLSSLPTAKERYDEIYALVSRISGVRTIDSKKTRTFKSGNISLVRFSVKGKTLNAYIGLDPKEYEGTKYIFSDVSDIKKYENYPMRLKITSDRQLRWAKELLNDKVTKSGLTVLAEPEITKESVSPFAHFKGKKSTKTFIKKLKQSPKAKERYSDLKSFLEELGGVRVIEGKHQVTYKRGSVSLVRFTVRGKTLNAYLGLDPTEYQNSKYIFTDVSARSKYRNYPMRVKATSDRQVKWIKELISIIINKG